LAEITPTKPSDTIFGSTSANPNEKSGGIGIEIETLASLPDAENYAEHEFYSDNFTASEIAYCLQQPSVKAAFGGLIAAKKAIVKAGAARGPLEGLSRIEILHDEEGKPFYPECFLSTTYTDLTALAICSWRTLPDPSFPENAFGIPRAALGLPGLKVRIFIAFVLLSLLFLFAVGLWFILHRVFH
jgi:phosphopantetheinyl transferase (holo-ACP synthase)